MNSHLGTIAMTEPASPAAKSGFRWKCLLYLDAGVPGFPKLTRLLPCAGRTLRQAIQPLEVRWPNTQQTKNTIAREP